MTPTKIKRRLEYLRGELRAERISQGELCELEALAPHIEPGDVELLEAAGVPESDAQYLVECGKSFDAACVMDFGVGVFQRRRP